VMDIRLIGIILICQIFSSSRAKDSRKMAAIVRFRDVFSCENLRSPESKVDLDEFCRSPIDVPICQCCLWIFMLVPFPKKVYIPCAHLQPFAVQTGVSYLIIGQTSHFFLH
jgi:hypothetical protein